MMQLVVKTKPMSLSLMTTGVYAMCLNDLNTVLVQVALSFLSKCESYQHGIVETS